MPASGLTKQLKLKIARAQNQRQASSTDSERLFSFTMWQMRNQLSGNKAEMHLVRLMLK